MPAWLRRILLLALLALPACVGTPQPSPPNLDGERVRSMSGAGADLGGVRIVGAAGAVDPASGSVVVTSLDGSGPPAAEPVRADGSFDVTLPGVPDGGVVRIQIRDGGARSVPLDLAYDLVTDRLSPVEARACLVIDPAAQLDVGEVRIGETRALEVVVDNGCPEAVELAPSRLRESGPFSATDPAATLDPGARATITVTVTPTARGTAEQTLFVEATAPTPDRRPLTLFVTGVD